MADAEGRGNRVPMWSLRGETPKATEALQTLLYLRELDRQATIFGACFDNARRLGLLANTDQDDMVVWANLQGALFAAIVVQRLLRPVEEQVRKHDHHRSRGESKRFAVARGKRLRKLLSVPDDPALFTVAEVRNDFEHVDERLDGLMRPDVICVSDWYISAGVVSQTGPSGDSMGYGLRVFMPNSGRLFYDTRVLDLYHLDLNMLDLRALIGQVTPQVAAGFTGRGLFGGTQAVTFAGNATERTRLWLADRAGRGHPIAE